MVAVCLFPDGFRGHSRMIYILFPHPSRKKRFLQLSGRSKAQKISVIFQQMILKTRTT